MSRERLTKDIIQLVREGKLELTDYAGSKVILLDEEESSSIYPLVAKVNGYRTYFTIEGKFFTNIDSDSVFDLRIKESPKKSTYKSILEKIKKALKVLTKF